MRILVSMLALVAAVLVADTAEAQRRARPRVQPTPFDAGRVSLSLGGGFNGNNGSIGGGLGYFVLKGLEVGVEGTVFLQEPLIGIVGPAARYIVWQVPTIHPYIGPLARYWIVGGDGEDRTSVGGRAGILTNQQPFYLSAGIAYERFISCEEAIEDCSFFTPELIMGFSF
jgi:hypothetical protein